jgi:hypothetical protein
VAIGFLMLLLTSLQGWGMVAILAYTGPARTELLQEMKRLHNLGLSGGFLAVSFGLALIALPVGESRSRTICGILLPSLLVAPVAFCDRALAILVGPIPIGLQAAFFSMQAVSALGITVSLALIVVFLLRDGKRSQA